MRLTPLLLSLCLLACPVWAESSSQQEVAKATLVAEQSVIVPGQSFRVGVRLQAPEGWHTYWKNPGDAGLATSLTWTLPEGVTAEPIDWPAPQRLKEGELVVHAYGSEVFLPVTLNAPATIHGDVIIKVKAEWLVCKDICLPESARLNLTLLTGEVAMPSEDAPLFARHTELHARILASPAHYSFDDHTLTISLPQIQPGGIAEAAFFPEQMNLIRYAAPQKMTLKDGILSIALERSGGAPEGTINGLLTLTSAGKTTHYQLAAIPGTTAPAPAPTFLPLLLLSALLGGLILNLMPCVLPVLSLKALAVLGKKDAEHSAVLKQGIAYTMGILVSFAAFALVLILLKLGGEAVGWGYQMQSPAFVGFLIYLLFLVGLNLSGVFELPVLLGNVGGKITGESSARGSFATGVLATAVATPCTAPFMAGAIGTALTLPAWQSLLVFEFLGLGLALPFLLISIFPALLHLLPKPGAWMETFRQLLAFPMYASVIWLMWVLTLQTGAGGMVVAATGMLALAGVVWMRKIFSAWSIFLLIGMILIWSLPSLSRMEGEGMMSIMHDMDTVAYSPGKLHEMRTAGKPVFVDATAAWCITCQVNGRVAIRTERTMKLFREKNITLMIADWTRRNADITTFLAGFGRNGVPLYVYYPPAGDPVVLPQLLTESIVENAVSQ